MMRLIQERTGDPLAWMAGLTPDERIAAVSPPTSGPHLAGYWPRPRHERCRPVRKDRKAPRRAAAAIADAEAALAHQNSASSQLDLQVISAILNAHLKALEGRDALDRLQQETEVAVRTRSDLDTPAGARDFQRFLIGKLRDIREVVANVSLDDTSKSALMAAWTSLYNASKAGEPVSGPAVAILGRLRRGTGDTAGRRRGPLPRFPDVRRSRPAGRGCAGAERHAARDDRPFATRHSQLRRRRDAGRNRFGLECAKRVSVDRTGPGTRIRAGSGRSGRLARDESEDPDVKDDEAKDVSSEKPESPPTGPTTVTLPNGETVTAASPQLAAAIKAAAGGVPIAEAFHRQGITIPAPGTAVADPVAPSRLIPGDIGIFTDHHALALGHDKALLDGQIQRISTVSGPSFLGWVHPPTPASGPAAGQGGPTGTNPTCGRVDGDRRRRHGWQIESMWCRPTYVKPRVITSRPPTTCGPFRRRMPPSRTAWTHSDRYSVSCAKPGANCSSCDGSATNSKPTTTQTWRRTCGRRRRSGNSTKNTRHASSAASSTDGP